MIIHRILRMWNVEDWKKAIALVILWAYAYQLVIWPLMFWITTVGTAATGNLWPAPPIVPWEQLGAGTATLAAVGGIETWREKGATPAAPKEDGIG